MRRIYIFPVLVSIYFFMAGFALDNATVPIFAYWFAWQAFHPGTIVYAATK